MLADSPTCLEDSTVLHDVCVGYEKIRLNTIIMWQICDLSSINEVKSFATKFTSMDKPLHVLVSMLFQTHCSFASIPAVFSFYVNALKFL